MKNLRPKWFTSRSPWETISLRLLLHYVAYNCGMLSIWHIPILASISTGCPSILIFPRISHGFPFSNYDMTAPPTQKVQEKILIFASSDILFCLTYTRLGLIRTPKVFWVASPRPVTFLYLHRSLELLLRSSVEKKKKFWLLIACPIFLPQQLRFVHRFVVETLLKIILFNLYKIMRLGRHAGLVGMLIPTSYQNWSEYSIFVAKISP